MNTNEDVRAGGILDEPTLEELKAVGMKQSALCQAWLDQYDSDTATMQTFALAKIETWKGKEEQDRDEALSKLNHLVTQSSQGGERLSQEEQAKVNELRELIHRDWARTAAIMLQLVKDTKEWALKGRADSMLVEVKMKAISFALEILDKKGLECMKEHPRGEHIGDVLASWDEDIKMSRLGWSVCRHYHSLDLPRRVFHPVMEKGQDEARE
ncbi:hypothetical protein PspLS_07754 [Pyricularia sp. CBS 133598]|nr:hypothetical protein PspLS_07754 [Pyricularia sp. CBS 133598]